MAAKKNSKKKPAPGRMPKWQSEQVNQQRSFEYVKRVFGDWRPIPLQEGDIAIDFRFEIIEKNGDTTGAEFCTQIKAQSKVDIASGGHLAYTMEVSTLSYFLRRPELILLIVYDATSEIAYWIWIQDFLRQNWNPKWAQQQTVTIRIPSTNILDQQAVKTIAKRVRWHHEKQVALAAVATSNNPFFKYHVDAGEDSISVGVSPKYPGAEKDNPIVISGTLKFDPDTPEGAEAFDRYERLVKFGEPLELDDRFIDGFEMPEVFSGFLAPTSGLRPRSLVLRSVEGDETIPMRFAFVSADGSVQSEIPFVELRRRRSGTEQVYLTNESQRIPYNVAMTISRSGEVTTEFQTDSTVSNTSDVLNIFSLSTILAIGGKAQATLLRDGQVFEIDVPKAESDPPPPWLLLFAQDIAIIEKRAGVSFTWPELLSREEANVARLVAEITKSGRGLVQLKAVTIPVDRAFAARLAKTYRKGEYGAFGFEMPNRKVTLMGVELDLGDGRLIIPRGRLDAESETLLDNVDSISPNETVNLTLDASSAPAVMEFPNWLKDESNKGGTDAEAPR